MFPISFNIYGMKLNEVHIFSGTVTIQLLNKFYEDKISEVILIVYYFENKEKCSQICICPRDFISIYLFVHNFAIKLKSANHIIYSNILAIYDQSKIMSDLNMFHGKVSDFVSFPLFGFTLVMNLRNIDFENYWNTLIFLIKKKDMVWGLNISHGKMSGFVSFPSLRFTWVIKLKNLDFEGH